MLIARHILVRGRVQGVSYRQSTAIEAARLGVSGWVRNLPDGAVEAHLEGDHAAVEALVLWCRRGPPQALVTALELDEATLLGCDGFDIRR
jgi:acylphosphatase